LTLPAKHRGVYVRPKLQYSDFNGIREFCISQIAGYCVILFASYTNQKFFPYTPSFCLLENSFFGTGLIDQEKRGTLGNKQGIPYRTADSLPTLFFCKKAEMGTKKNLKIGFGKSHKNARHNWAKLCLVTENHISRGRKNQGRWSCQRQRSARERHSINLMFSFAYMDAAPYCSRARTDCGV